VVSQLRHDRLFTGLSTGTYRAGLTGLPARLHRQTAILGSRRPSPPAVSLVAGDL